MKKFTLLLTAALFALPSLARDFEYNGLTYTVLDEDARTCETKSGDEWSFTAGNEAEGDLVIPSTVYDGDIEYSVTEIGDRAFYGCGSLTSVELPSSVTVIGEYAFSSCYNMVSVELPSVTEIGIEAFSGCASLTFVELPSSVTEIGRAAFGDCSTLNDIFVSDDNPAYCSQTGILFDKSCECLCIYPSGRDGQYAIPSSVTKIGMGAFYGCRRLTSVDIPSSVTEIGDYAFSDCQWLTSIEIPSSVTEISRATFYNCPSLASVELPSSVTKIGDFAFSSCDSLTFVELPSSVTEIGYNAFSSCDSLTSVELPSSVTKIGIEAFSRCYSLVSVEIPSSVTEISQGIFYNCKGLSSVDIPSSVTKIDDEAFFGCESLISVEIPSSVTEIGAWRVFFGCNSLTSVYYGAETLIKASEDIFDPDTYANATLYVRESALPQAETVTPWCLFANREAFDFEVGVKGVSADGNTTVEVYTLDGVKVGASTDELPTGVYIVRQGSDVRKIAVK